MKMKIRSILTLGAAAVALLIASCSEYPGFKKTESGIRYKFYVENKDSLKPVEGSILKMNIIYRMKIGGKDSIFFNSKDNNKPFEVNLAKSEFKGDIFEALAMLHKGDSATFVINAYDFFTKTAKYPQIPEGIDSNSMMLFDVKLLQSETREERLKADAAKAEKLKNEETGKLNDYISRNKITVKPTESGVYVVTQNPGSGRGIVKTDIVTINLTVSSIEGKKIFSTLDKQKPITFEFGQKFDTKGFDEAIGQMKKGTKATIVVPSAMAFGERGKKDMNGEDIIAPFSPVVYDVEVLNLKTKAESEKENKEAEAKASKASAEARQKEPALILQYVKDNKISAKPNGSGLYYVEKVKGKGEKAVAGKKVKVHYTGKLFNGKVFDSSLDRKPSTPYEFTLGRGEVIAGWDEGIAMMNVGGKATLIIPSKLGYGERGAGGDIPPFAPLVFEVELVAVSAK